MYVCCVPVFLPRTYTIQQDKGALGKPHPWISGEALAAETELTLGPLCIKADRPTLFTASACPPNWKVFLSYIFNLCIPNLGFSTRACSWCVNTEPFPTSLWYWCSQELLCFGELLTIVICFGCAPAKHPPPCPKN